MPNHQKKSEKLHLTMGNNTKKNFSFCRICGHIYWAFRLGVPHPSASWSQLWCGLSWIESTSIVGKRSAKTTAPGDSGGSNLPILGDSLMSLMSPTGIFWVSKSDTWKNHGKNDGFTQRNPYMVPICTYC